MAEIDRQVSELLQLRQELTQILQRWLTAPPTQSGVICPNLQV